MTHYGGKDLARSFRQVRGNTIQTAEDIPGDKYGFQASPDTRSIGAGGLTRRIFVAVVHVSVTVQPTESDEAELSTRCSPSARRQAA